MRIWRDTKKNKANKNWLQCLVFVVQHVCTKHHHRGQLSMNWDAHDDCCETVIITIHEWEACTAVKLG